MPYEYDVFFSYKRDLESYDWHKKVKEKLEHWLKNELGGLEANIFFDTEDISSGELWQQKIESALKKSKCIVCIWSPVYFKSKWCFSEWLTFEERSKTYKRNLVSPARYHDGEYYPQKAKDRQAIDFSEYACTIPSFWDTALAVDFEMKRLRPFAGVVAAMIRSAPSFDANFPIVVAKDNQILDQDEQIGRIADV